MKPDVQLQRDILDELDWEPRVDAAEIGVTVDDGVVTLTGHVTTYDEKLAAERATQRVAGVKAVANDIEVRPGGSSARDDTDIAKATVDALNWRVSVPAELIKVAVSKGWVTLEGEVDWQFQRESAEDAVRPLLGVRGVINEIVVKPKASATEVKSRIEAAFQRSSEIDATKVQIEAHEGKVTLLGDVRSWAEREEAERTAWAAPGVYAVENRIVVIPYATA
jgi:osmotically-inducible protein OsmY